MENAIAFTAASGHAPGPMRGPQVRAARELLGLSQIQLCEAAGVSRPTLRDIEAETGDPKRSSLEKVRAYLQGRGIRFVDDPGVVGLPPETGKPA